eukprot:gene590-6125_t
MGGGTGAVRVLPDAPQDRGDDERPTGPEFVPRQVEGVDAVVQRGPECFRKPRRE